MSTRPAAAVFTAFALLSAGASAADQGHHPHWSYKGTTGPTHWGALESEFGACGVGHAQSPIDIRLNAVQPADLPAITFDYQSVPLKVIDNGHTIQVNYAPGSFIDVGGHRFDLVQFHFHKPSEESIDGKRYDMVAHLVHRDVEGHLGVVAVPLTAGKLNTMIATVWSNLPKQKNAEVAVSNVQINAADLLPADRGYFTFAGSLTTPPCSEGVSWFVLKQPSQLSAGEIARFGQTYAMNARPLQPLHGRKVLATR